MPAHPKIRYTYEDYLATPEDSSRRYEIVDGELFVTAAPRFRHQQVVTNLAGILHSVALEHGLGEVLVGPITVRLADDSVTEPDVVFVHADRLGLIDRQGVQGAPDLVVEVLSPSNQEYDRTLKRKRYMASEVAELWLVDADAGTIEVWRPDLGEPRVVRDRLIWHVAGKDFEVPLGEVFRGG